MLDPAHVLRRRFNALVASLALAVVACITLAAVVARNANGTLRQLADVELEAAMLARQFRAAVDDVHGALLRIGGEPADESAALIAQRRQRLTTWLAARSAAIHSDEERQIIQLSAPKPSLISSSSTASPNGRVDLKRRSIARQS